MNQVAGFLPMTLAEHDAASAPRAGDKKVKSNDDLVGMRT
jgi:hypothetical protein